MRICAVMVTALALCLSGCGGAQVKDAQQCADGFLKSFEIGDMQGMYQLLSDGSKAVMSYDQFRTAHLTVLNRLGTLLDWKRTGFSPVPDTGNAIFLATYDCNFGNYKAVIQLKVRKQGKVWTLVGYNYQSEGLRGL